jgi:hypothetical protein
MFTSVTRSNVNSNKSLTKAHKALEWYFYHSESAMGWKSNFSSIMMAWFYSTKIDDENVEDKLISLIDDKKDHSPNILESASKQRKIFEACQQLSAKHQNILAAYFEERQPEIDIKFLFDSKLYTTTNKSGKEVELDGLAPGIRLLAWTKTALSTSDFSLMWLKKAVKKDPTSFNKVREEADLLYFNALKAFAKIYK